MLEKQLSVNARSTLTGSELLQSHNMFSARAFIAHTLREAVRPQVTRLTIGSRLASTRAPATISEAITHDHRELRRYYDEIVNNKGNFGA
jgi:hypothetical protein